MSLPDDMTSSPSAADGSTDVDLLAEGDEWWLVACLDWPRDRWIGYVEGYRRAAAVLANEVARTGRNQDYLVYPFLMCWRQYIELQLKLLLRLIRTYRREIFEVPRTHRVDILWQWTRPRLKDLFPGVSDTEFATVERVLTQLQDLDPSSEHFRYPISKDGSETLTSLRRVHLGRCHAAMEQAAQVLEAAELALRHMIGTRDEHEAVTGTKAWTNG